MIVFSVTVLTVAGVLLVSATSKLRSRDAYQRFRSGIVELGVVPARLAGIAAGAAIAGELTTLAIVAVPATAAIGLLLAGAMFTVFALVLARAVARGAATSCHCFGATSDTVAMRHVGRTAFLALLACTGSALGLTGQATHLWAAAPSTILVVAVSVLVVAAVVYLDEIIWLFAGPSR